MPGEIGAVARKTLAVIWREPQLKAMLFQQMVILVFPFLAARSARGLGNVGWWLPFCMVFSHAWLALSLLGIPLQEGRGERSARIDILEVVPELGLSKIRLPSGETLEIPTVTLGRILNIQLDPADLGSPAQRVVHARVEKLGVSGDEAAPP